MIDVSVILPVYNGAEWFSKCLQSVYQQNFDGRLQLSVYNDGSTDASMAILDQWKQKLQERRIDIVVGGHDESKPRGVGFAKNRAVDQCSGAYLCFLDADDVMQEDRVAKQLEAAKVFPKAIIGCKFHRKPNESTARFTQWANRLSPQQLHMQVYTSHGPTVIMPTWFMSRTVFDKVGGFIEGRNGVPEDLIFFYAHLESGGEVSRVDEDLLMYRYHPAATTFSIKRETIWHLRVNFLQSQLIDGWNHFTIWNAGKQGRRLFRSLSEQNQKKVAMFCDVDEKKISKGQYIYEESKEKHKPVIPVVHFTEAKPPVIICVKLDLTGGEFEQNLASMKLVEGKDFFHFN